MSLHDFASQRLHVDAALEAGARIALERQQAHYLLNVLRMKPGDALLVFNGRDGEWRARLEPEGRKSATLVCEAQTRPQPPQPELAHLFAPLKQARLDYMVQKAVEMGAGRLVPVLTRRTQVTRLNPERLRANAVEAAEQCGILSLPDILPEQPLAAALAALEPQRRIVFCDEEAPAMDALQLLRGAAGAPLAVLIGPEGGFTPEERALVLARPGTLRLWLGPRILRADTAAVAALALVQAAAGDLRPGD